MESAEKKYTSLPQSSKRIFPAFTFFKEDEIPTAQEMVGKIKMVTSRELEKTFSAENHFQKICNISPGKKPQGGVSRCAQSISSQKTHHA